MLKNEIEIQIHLKNNKKITRVNLSNTQTRSWDHNNIIEIKSKKIMKLNS